jgi:hypothetical protein
MPPDRPHNDGTDNHPAQPASDGLNAPAHGGEHADPGPGEARTAGSAAPSAFDFDSCLNTGGFEAADDTDTTHRELRINDTDFLLLKRHHQADSTFALLYDTAAVWDVPGTARLLAVHLARDRASRTFRIRARRMPLLSLAQQWLVARGCPPEALVLGPGSISQPADAATAELEEHLRSSADRYTLVDHYTDDGEPFEAWALLRDSHPAPDTAAFRLIVESADVRAGTYTLREGAFADEQAAWEWLDDRDRPLPSMPRTAGPPSAARAAVMPSAETAGRRR